MRITKKKLTAVVATTAVVALGGVAAYAYWTTNGTGSGDKSVGTDSALTVVQTSAVSGLTPDGTTAALSGTFNNPNAGPVSITAVTKSSITIDSGHATAGCLSTWFSVTGTDTAGLRAIPVGDGQGAWSGLTLHLDNVLATNQDACKGATVTVAYAVA